MKPLLCCLLLSIGLLACQAPAPVSSEVAAMAENLASATAITPRTKGSTLEITPRSKGPTQIQGQIELPMALDGEFEIEFRQNNVLLSSAPMVRASSTSFSVQNLPVQSDTMLHVEARSTRYPQLVMMCEIMVPTQIPDTLEVKISIPATSAVYLARHLDLPSQTAEALLAESSSALAPLNEMVESYFRRQMAGATQETMESMPDMQASLEKSRMMWSKLQDKRP